MAAVMIYSSLTGHTEKYATWISDELQCDIFRVSDISISQLTEYDTIIFGGWLHAAGIKDIELIKKALPLLRGKKIIVFATGASPKSDAVIKEVINSNFSKEESSQIHFFYLRGGFDYMKLDFVNKCLMQLLKFKIILKPEDKRTDDEKGMIAAYNHSVDFTKRENISSIIQLVEE